MKTAKRLSRLQVLLFALGASATPLLAQGHWPDSPLEAARNGKWIPSNGGVVSAEYATSDAANQAIFDGRTAREKRLPRPVSDTISVTRLQNPPPAKAVKELEKGAKAVAEGDREQAIEHYRRAIEIHPNYIEAYNNLGVQCLRLGRNNEALGMLERAVELDPGSVEPHLNMAVALHALGQLDAAAYQAKIAVEMAPQSATANMGLGLVLAAQGRNLEEAVRRLQFASSEHPGAALAAADALLQLNRPKEAQLALRTFLNRDPGAIK